MNDDQPRKSASKGGQAISSDRDHMADIGQKGGTAGGGQGDQQSTRGGTSEQHRAAGEQILKSGSYDW